MLKLVDRPRLGRGEFIHISSSLITHTATSSLCFKLTIVILSYMIII